MIGPLGSYQQIYVAMCGQQFTTHAEGRSHERTCHACAAWKESEQREHDNESEDDES
jgi:hypothetical protein